MAAFNATGPVGMEHVEELLEHFSKTSYSPKTDVKGMLTMDTCLMLFGRDYKFSVINNTNGDLCGHYPSKIVVLEYECSSVSHENFQGLVDTKKLEDLMRQARIARCRSRFVVPVILYNGRHICRSATLSGWQELFSRKGIDFLSGAANKGAAEESSSSNMGNMQMFDRYRGMDIQLLNQLEVRHICDLMVEQKKVKYGMNITSSEKVDKENRYRNFSLISLPYPGCEFFSDWKDNNYASDNIQYDWSQECNTAELDLNGEPLLSSIPVDWNRYKEWDLIQLTQNYMRVLIELVRGGTSGVLIHCISGWDRTPLFVSLLRLSLWADGVVHKSLEATDILYLTLAYDWYLFGHCLTDRVSKGQEVMYFCFKMLHHISGQEFSVGKERDHEETVADQASDQTRNTERPSPRSQAGTHFQNSKTCQCSCSESSTDFQTTFFMDGVCDDYCDSECQLRRQHNSGEDSRDTLAGRENPHDLRNGTECHHCRHSFQTEFDHTSDQEQPVSLVSSHFSSSPVNVPSVGAQCQEDVGFSPSLSSWQLISETGSLHSTPASRHIQSPNFCTNQGNSHTSCEEAEELNKIPQRWQRLNAVAYLFENAYTKIISSKTACSTSSGSLSSIIGNFAEKVGLRSGPR